MRSPLCYFSSSLLYVIILLIKNFFFTNLFQDSAKLSLWEVREESTINITGLNLRNEEGNEVEGINWVNINV